MKRGKLLSPSEVLALRRQLVDPAELRSIGQARERYKARLRSGWDCYEDAIKAAHEGDADRLVDLLRAHKPLADADRDRLATFIGKKLRRRCWPRWLKDALSRAPTEDDYDLLADLVAEVYRKRGRIADAPAHRAARLARVLLPLVPRRMRDELIAYASEVTSQETGVKIEQDQVRELLDRPRRIRS